MPLLVSIHAPWEGCDQHLFYCEDRTDSFNSRTLGRVRPLSSVTFICASMFQFTHPGKGATSSSIRQRSIFLWFQFTHPGKGATTYVYYLRCPRYCFNSRTLGRVRPTILRPALAKCCVSIHAPWEGCDGDGDVQEDISGKFQFTHPGKGATVANDGAGAGLIGFNSRTLGRVRQTIGADAYTTRTFQFTHPGKGATLRREAEIGLFMFQFTHPGKGATCSFVLSRL